MEFGFLCGLEEEKINSTMDCCGRQEWLGHHRSVEGGLRSASPKDSVKVLNTGSPRLLLKIASINMMFITSRG